MIFVMQMMSVLFLLSHLFVYSLVRFIWQILSDIHIQDGLGFSVMEYMSQICEIFVAVITATLLWLILEGLNQQQQN